MTTREFGTVVRFFSDRSPPFGFIQPDQIGDDIFLAERALQEAGIVSPIEPGTRVSYEPRPSKKSGRLQAWDVSVLE